MIVVFLNGVMLDLFFAILVLGFGLVAAELTLVYPRGELGPDPGPVRVEEIRWQVVGRCQGPFSPVRLWSAQRRGAFPE